MFPNRTLLIEGIRKRTNMTRKDLMFRNKKGALGSSVGGRREDIRDKPQAPSAVALHGASPWQLLNLGGCACLLVSIKETHGDI